MWIGITADCMRALSTFDDIFSVFPTVEGGVTLLSGLKDLFMPAASAYVTSYFLVFFVGALFGAVYQFTGAAESIAKWIAGMCKGRYVVLSFSSSLVYSHTEAFPASLYSL